jgi:N-carbamoyl-L-amino-acid hydrolase
MMAAVRMISAIEAATMDPADVKLTVGLFQVTPNAPSVVPSEVLFSVDLRHPDNAVVDRVDEAIRRIVQDERGPCEAELNQIQYAPSLEFPQKIRDIIAAAADRCSIPTMDIYSVAGHDARQLHYVCPTGMIFVPCRAGISHNPEEWAEKDDLVACTKVLSETLAILANSRSL